jgi:hypothetical protein
MIYSQKAFNSFIKISLTLMLVMAISFGVSSPESWAAMGVELTSTTAPIQLAKVREVMSTNQQGNSDEAQTAATEEAKRFKAATLEGMTNSIVNPAYKPSGKTNQVKKQDAQDMKDIKTEASDMFNKS